MKVCLPIKLRGKYVPTVNANEFVEIIKSLSEENKELKKKVEVMEEILHSYLPIIENVNKET